jgi:RHS repeat-associated protein
VTWTASSTGTVSATLRYDPWGSLTASTGSSLPDFRFQGSWYDTTTDLSWVVTRWYAPSLGRFISEDSLLGDPADPPSRHLYAYGTGDPVGRWDPDGRYEKLIYKETIELPDWYGLAWTVATAYTCVFWISKTPFKDIYKGIGSGVCEIGASAAIKTKSDRVIHYIYVWPYSAGKYPSWAGDNVYTVRSRWVYWIRTVNDTFIYKGYFDEFFRANQSIVLAYSNWCALSNSDKGWFLNRTCLGMW